MRTRHRMPTIFTLSMLDVFCCALGCVILLWLWNERLAKMRLKAADETRQQLDYARTELASARAAIEALNADLSKTRAQAAGLADDLAGARAQVADLTTQRDRTAVDLGAARRNLADLKDQLARKSKEHEEMVGAAAALLEKKRKDEDALRAQVAQAQKRVQDLEVLMRDRDKELTVTSAKSKELADQLHDLEGQLKMLRSRADASLDEQGKKLSAAESRVQELEKFLSTRKSIMIDMQGKLDELQGERKSLSEQLAKLRLAADNRFAGIQLSGRRVVFLVDMSGSMKMADDKTVAPDKWATVISTVVRVMKSLPDLEKYQVIVFNESASFPLGAPGDWLDYDAASSAERVRDTLARVEPKGNTNMYAPLDAAFRLRGRGLDTVYLLSDGLPNAGPGLAPAEQSRPMSDEEKGVILGRHIRQTLRQNWNRPAAGLPNVRINSIGFFYESPDLGAFLWALARENDGSFVGMSKP